MALCPSCGHDNRIGASFCEACGGSLDAPAARAREQRKTVTVLFCDLTGSTALGESLDPERLRAFLARYFERMKEIVELHGGTVEKFIGDAVMAVFGVPVSHEDDALRAVRAAVEMRAALPELGLEGRIGVTTGEVVTGTEERLATGDAVNVAARLEQAARPGDVLMGAPTLALVRDVVDVEPTQPLDLKGKAEPVPAYRLLSVKETPGRRHDARFVGRERELAVLREWWERVRAQERCELVTLVGDAGVGKTRLAAEALAAVDAAVARGRCLPYGAGVTYWPVVEVLKQLDVLPSDETAATAIRSVLGETDAPTSAEEIAWAFRKTLEQAAGERPLVVLFDDLQWGERTFLDLVEHIALLSSGAPLLLLCLARPELIERRPDWAVTVRLEPLDEDEVAELMPTHLAAPLQARIARASGGNPLFVEEMLAMAAQAEEGDAIVPPTLKALLAARLDLLETAERSVLERGAVEGETFHRGAVQALAPGEAQVTPRLAALVRKELIRPEKAVLAGEDGFRFRHILIRDAAYDALPKAVRADFHERLAAWLEDRGTSLTELDELLGYHLEQAWRYRTELGIADDSGLAAAARRRLTASGMRAAARQDYDAAVGLLERAAALVPPSEIDVVLEAELREVLVWTGRAEDALRRADELTERASAAGDRIGELSGRIQGAVLRSSLQREGAVERLATLLDEALPVLEDAGDDLALFIGYSALGRLAGYRRGRVDEALQAFERASAHARRAGYEPAWMLGTLAWCRFMGTMPVSELLEWLDEVEPRARRDQFFRAYRAWSLARIGRFDEARAILAAARADQAERGGGTLLANLVAFESVWVELLAGDPAAAAKFGAEGCRMHEELGNHGFLATAAGSLAQALYALDRLDETEAWVERAVEVGAERHAQLWGRMLWRQAKAKVLARRGDHADAQRLAREAVTIGDHTELLDNHGDAYADLAEVLVLGGRRDDAAAAFTEAVEHYERKGNLASLERVRTRLAELSAGTPASRV